MYKSFETKVQLYELHQTKLTFLSNVILYAFIYFVAVAFDYTSFFYFQMHICLHYKTSLDNPTGHASNYTRYINSTEVTFSKIISLPMIYAQQQRCMCIAYNRTNYFLFKIRHTSPLIKKLSK